MVSVEGSYDTTSNIFTLSSLQASAPNTNPEVHRTVGFSDASFNVSAIGFSADNNNVLIGLNTGFQPSGRSVVFDDGDVSKLANGD